MLIAVQHGMANISNLQILIQINELSAAAPAVCAPGKKPLFSSTYICIAIIC